MAKEKELGIMQLEEKIEILIRQAKNTHGIPEQIKLKLQITDYAKQYIKLTGHPYVRKNIMEMNEEQTTKIIDKPNNCISAVNKLALPLQAIAWSVAVWWVMKIVVTVISLVKSI